MIDRQLRPIGEAIRFVWPSFSERKFKFCNFILKNFGRGADVTPWKIKCEQIKIPATLLVMLLHALPVVAVVLNPEMFVSFALPFLTFLGPSILSFLSAQVMKRVFARYPAGEKG